MTPDDNVDPQGYEVTTEDWENFRRQCRLSLYFTAKVLCQYDQIDPKVHTAFCGFLQNDSVLDKAAMMPRDHRKTTAGTKAGSVWEIIRNPNIRILLGNEVDTNAQTMLKEIRWHFESNPWMRFFFPELIPENHRKTTWSNSAIQIPRTAKWGEPTIDTIGMGGTRVSQHYDLLLFDDLIGLKHLKSATEMKHAIQWLNYSVGLKSDHHTTRTHLIGTRWDLTDIYWHAITNMGFKEFRRGALVMGPKGPEPFYPLVISMEKLEQIIVSDPFQWATNFANNPYDASTSDFKQEWLRGQDFTIAPDGDIRYKDETGSMQIQKWTDLVFYLHVDPSMGERDKSNETAMVLVGLSPKHLVFIVDAWKERIDPVTTVDRILEYQDQHVPRKTTVEGVAYQKALIYFVNDRARLERRYVNIESFLPGTRQDKLTRIRFTLQPYFRDRLIYYRGRQFQFVDEYNHFGREHPDILDALSQGPSVWQFPMDQATIRKRVAKYERYERTGSTGYGM